MMLDVDPNDAQPERLEDAEALIPQQIVVLNPEGKAIYANRVSMEYTGLSLEEVRASGAQLLITTSVAVGIELREIDYYCSSSPHTALTSNPPPLREDCSFLNGMLTVARCFLMMRAAIERSANGDHTQNRQERLLE